MSLIRRLIAIAMIVSSVILMPSLSSADQFDHYRKYIDNSQNYSLDQRDRSIQELEALKTADIEKNYLLGMLYLLQGIESMKASAQAKKDKPRAEDILKEPAIRRYFEKAEQNYDTVEKTNPGYKYIYCKYAELYRYSFNEDGLRRVTNRVGMVVQNERVEQCKGAIENIAEGYATYGYANLSKVIYEEAVRSWQSYPKYMLEALGDIENVRNNPAQAKYWWKRCDEEAEKSDRKKRCQDKFRK